MDEQMSCLVHLQVEGELWADIYIEASLNKDTKLADQAHGVLEILMEAERRVRSIDHTKKDIKFANTILGLAIHNRKN